jgi:transposase
MAGKFLDRAGWHGATCLKVPDCITLVPLPAYSPELNSVERIWEHLILSHIHA